MVVRLLSHEIVCLARCQLRLWQMPTFLMVNEKYQVKIWDFSDLNQGPVDLQSNALPAAPKSLYDLSAFPLIIDQLSSFEVFFHNQHLWASVSEATGSVPTTQSSKRKVGLLRYCLMPGRVS